MGCGESKEQVVGHQEHLQQEQKRSPEKQSRDPSENIAEERSRLKSTMEVETASSDREVSSRIQNREAQINMHTKSRKAVRGRFLNFDSNFVIPNTPKEEADFKFLDEALGENFIFSDLSTKERHLLINAMQKEEASAGQTVIQQGDVGDFFYICETGTITFVADGKEVGSCGKGGSFGELALLYDSPRAATCLAGTDVKLWKVDQGTFRQLLARTAKEQEGSIVDVLAKVPLLKDLDRRIVSKFASTVSSVKFAEGETIVRKGDAGDIFYILHEGQVRVHDIGLGDASYSDQVLKTGDWFGERALMTGEPRAANVTAMTAVTAFACTREMFETTIGSLENILGADSKKRFIRSVPIFAKSELLPIEYDHLVSMLAEKIYKKGEKLAEAGKPMSKNLLIVKEGKLIITNGEGKIFFLGSGDYFGDKAVSGTADYIPDETCVCEEDTACWMLQRCDIESVIGDVERLGHPIPFTPASLNTNLVLQDIKRYRILGMGAFGKVWLATTSESRRPYALKTIDKRQLMQANQIKGVLREKHIMASIEHPFILALVGSFQDEDNLYLLLPLIQGGELFNVIHTDKRDGVSNEASMFYGACILEALGYLHDRSIVYRDMKPENALIDANGYCVMVDLGFAKIVVDKSYTLCGTPEYLAPEIIMSKGHDKAVDYWSFGVLVYEMLVGRSPFFFYGTDQVSLFKRIVMVKYSCPSSVNDEAKDLIKKLLTRRQTNRLGNLSRGYLDVKEHPWFASLDFTKLNNQTLPAPWVPEVKNPLDSSHFEDFSKEERDPNYGRALNAKEQNLFSEF